MALIDFPCLPLLITLFTVALTSFSNAEGTDGTSSVTPRPDHGGPSSEPSFSPEYEHRTPDDEKGSKENDVVRKRTFVHNVASTKISTEGGPVSIPAITQHLKVEDATAKDGLDTLDELRTRENVFRERSASIIARKGVEERVKEKIKPRKGVEQEPERTDVVFNQTDFRNAKPVTVKTSSAQTETVHIDNQPEASRITTSESNVVSQSKESANQSTYSKNLTTLNVSHSETVDNITKPQVSSPTEKQVPRPKPLITMVDGPEVDDYRPSSRTKGSPLGTSRKINYIVPVLITILALPLLGTAIFVLYKRGRDCWDKRHYRRMDFLIDGMYND